VDELFSKLKST
jgi:hypothetical protein